jgi:hypothetical protein
MVERGHLVGLEDFPDNEEYVTDDDQEQWDEEEWDEEEWDEEEWDEEEEMAE